MKIGNLVIGIIIIAIGALFLVDAILITYDPAGQVLSPNDMKGIVGMVFVILAAIYFKNATE